MSYSEKKQISSASSTLPSGAPSTSIYRHVLQQIAVGLGYVGVLIIMSVVIIVGEHLTTNSSVFLTETNLFNLGRQTAVSAIVAMGMTFVIVSGAIDLSVGSIMGLAACSFAAMYSEMRVPLIPAVALALAISVFFGWLNGFLVVKGRLQPFIATLGTMSMARACALLITSGRSVSGFPPEFKWAGSGLLLGLPIVLIVIMVIVGVASHFVLSTTKLGLMAYALGGNEEATWLSGNPTGLYRIYIFVVSGLLSGIGGLLMAARLGSAHPALGSGEEFNAIAAVVIGGASLAGGEGMILGTVIGALIMAVIRNGLNLLSVSPYWQQFAIGFVVIAAVLFDVWRPGKQK